MVGTSRNVPNLFWYFLWYRLVPLIFFYIYGSCSEICLHIWQYPIKSYKRQLSINELRQRKYFRFLFTSINSSFIKSTVKPTVYQGLGDRAILTVTLRYNSANYVNGAAAAGRHLSGTCSKDQFGRSEQGPAIDTAALRGNTNNQPNSIKHFPTNMLLKRNAKR